MMLLGSSSLSTGGEDARRRFRGFLTELLEEELRESSTSTSDDLESFADFLLLLRILNAADIVVVELENFAPNNRISILWSWHGRGLER
jgi:hypothetical protein